MKILSKKIEIKSIENISIIDENSSFECMVTDVNVINHFYGDYLVCEALSLRNPNIEETTDITDDNYIDLYNNSQAKFYETYGMGQLTNAINLLIVLFVNTTISPILDETGPPTE